MIPIVRKLPSIECLSRKKETTNKKAGETESKTCDSVSQIFYLFPSTTMTLYMRQIMNSIEERTMSKEIFECDF